jgi:chemotaxis protein methyltransferase CheR
VTPLDYDYVRKLLRERSGLVLSADKQYLVESRLLPVARRAGMAGLTELVQELRKGSKVERLVIEVVEAMTTNESFFFRDKVPFEQFRNAIMPELLATRAASRRIRIWCAAASTGQEPYSLAMSLKEMANAISGWRIEIVATDLSNEVLEKARAGIYSQFEVQRGLPIQFLVKYFSQIGDTWQIAPDIRAMVQFRPLNLLADFSHLGTFDVVFCRNVLIYFDQETKTSVLDRIARVVDRNGYLSLGAAETVVGLTDAFKPVPDKRGLYAPNPAKGMPTLRIVSAR